MRLITVCGPTATGKTSVLLHAIGALQRRGRRAGVIKMDCLATGDDQVYAEHGIPVQVGLSGGLCPDHYFSVNIDECCAWAEEQNLDFLLCESAGL
ncbi:MAG: hypothetical protein LBT22_04190, partial [Peptococcaceae bacterium]|nr:hypothetical protein [Peptococcaceae bacterium]